ncbi:MAG: hypothetical protein JWR72_828 [Flavisolibacter sp.]|jgi:hypothetical protein|nr:hypothetical protein [Flavisolibacter sp.]
MNTTNDPQKDIGNPDKAYRDELANKGNAFTDTPSESDARDRAKIEKAQTGETQKMDGGDPDEFDDGELGEEIRRETLENK